MKNELAFKNHDSACAVARALLAEEYVVMLSKEEDLIILNYEWAADANRNEVVFMSQEEFFEELEKKDSE